MRLNDKYMIIIMTITIIIIIIIIPNNPFLYTNSECTATEDFICVRSQSSTKLGSIMILPAPLYIYMIGIIDYDIDDDDDDDINGDAEEDIHHISDNDDITDTTSILIIIILS